MASEMTRSALRLLVVLVCVAGASWGFAAGPHSMSHAVVGASQPAHHHGTGGHVPQMMDDGTPAKARRRIRKAVARLLPAPVVAAWVALMGLVRRRPTVAPFAEVWTGRLVASTSLTRLAVCRT